MKGNARNEDEYLRIARGTHALFMWKRGLWTKKQAKLYERTGATTR